MTLLTRRATLAAGGVVVLALGASVVGLTRRRKPLLSVAPGPSSSTPLEPPSDWKKADPIAAAPAMVFQTVSGAPTTLASFRGRPVVLNFWATWCIPCVSELPELDRLAEAAPDLTVLAVSADHGGRETVARFLFTHPITHASVLLDARSEAVHDLGVVGFPTTLLIDAQGRLRDRLEGPAAWSNAAESIRKLVG